MGRIPLILNRLSARPWLVAIAFATLLGSSGATAASLSVSAGTLFTYSRTYSGATTCTLQAVADAHVREDDPVANFGTGLTIDVDAPSGAARRAFLRFDLTGCTPAISADAILHDATLRMTLASPTADARTYELRRVSAAWVENVLQWGNQPATASLASASVTLAAGQPAASLVELSVASDVQDFVSGAVANDGWRLTDAAEGSAATSLLQIHSREATSDRPVLVITYAP